MLTSAKHLTYSVCTDDLHVVAESGKGSLRIGTTDRGGGREGMNGFNILNGHYGKTMRDAAINEAYWLPILSHGRGLR